MAILKYLFYGAAAYVAYTYLQHQYDLARYNELQNLVISTNNASIDQQRLANAGDISKNVYVDKRTGRGYRNAAYM